MRPAIILFAKAPVPGRVKTRLAARLSVEQAAELHGCFVRDMLEMLAVFAPVADLELHSDTEGDEWRGLEVARFRQVEGDLGRRLLHALEEGLKAGREKVVIAGSDAPTLPAGYIARLLNSRADVALGPCEDGGYYAIACRRTHPRMFAGVQWSGSQALMETAQACRTCGLTVEFAEPWFDVDTPADFERLAVQGPLPRHTAGWLEGNAPFDFPKPDRP